MKNVLFNTSLSPKLVSKSNNFYGIEIDLAEINRTVKTVADYQKEKLEWLEKIDGLKKSVSELTEKTEKEKDNLKRKYQLKIRERNDAIKENDYFLEQNEIKHSEATVKQNAFIVNAEIEKKKAIEKVDLAIEEAISKELLAKSEVGRAEEELGKLIKSKEKDRDKKIEAEEEKVKQLLINVEAEVKVEREANQKRKNELNAQNNKELSNKGADTKRLSEIKTRLTEIKVELDFIETNRETVSDYKKDKRELFDKIDEFKTQKQSLDKQLEQELKKYNQQKETIKKDIETIRLAIDSLEEILKNLKDDNEAFENFKDSECYKTIQEYFVESDEENKTKKRVKHLTEELKDIVYGKIHKQTEELKEIVINFLGKFSEENIFKFKKQLPDTKAFLDFSEMLSGFVGENKIERIEKEVNERFALIIATIGTQTNSLVAESGKIQGVITKINNDFLEKDFAGVIKKIELKVDESKNEVVQLLIKIKKYNDENSLELGEASIFSSESQEKKNKDAIDLLKQFVKKIGEKKRDFISLSDSFELKFRIEENQNDTGWVEKLSNVGSEGTDVLVKAMLNIMLLNVFKEVASKRFKDFQLHCMMDEIGKLHPSNVRGILKFANDRNILLINSSPIENDALAFKHIYKLKKDEKSITRVNRILTRYPEK